jgi:pyrroline-5-carboxylate reductase
MGVGTLSREPDFRSMVRRFGGPRPVADFQPASFPMNKKIGFIGAGQMARALAGGFVKNGLVSGNQISASDPAAAATKQLLADVPGATVAEDNTAVVAGADVVFLAVKPHQMQQAIAQIDASVRGGTLFVSIAAGLPLARLTKWLDSSRVIRVMPNTPSLVGKGAAAFCPAAGATPADRQLVAQLLGCVGLAVELDERLIDAVTGLSGSGPAYVYLLIEALSDGGVKMGLPRDVATSLAAHTVQGAAEMVLAAQEHPAVLRDRVTSPGGTTIAGLAELERGGMRAAVLAAVEAATKRSVELAGG